MIRNRESTYRANPSITFHPYFEELNLFITVLCSWQLQKRWSLEAAGGGGGFKLPTPLPREEKKRKRKKKKPKTFWGEGSLGHHTSRHWSATHL